MPRPREDADGNLVPEKDLLKLWVVYSEAGSIFLQGYLSKRGEWNRNLASAAAWAAKEDAEAAAAAIIVSNPGLYFGKVRVMEIKG